MSHYNSNGLGRFTDKMEETAIGLILGAMTMITFINVVLRYGFNSGLIWGLEAVSVLFSWLVLFGISYCVKITAHIGVDSVINLFASKGRRRMALLATAISIIYAFLLLKGSYDYYANFANLPATTGQWFPTGLQEMKLTNYRGWYEMDRLPMPEWLRFIEAGMNEGERYNKLPRFIPYFILPVGFSLLLYRLVQAFVHLTNGNRETLIVSHEAEDDVKEAGAKSAALGE